MKRLLALALFLTTSTFFAQGVVTGTVIDSQMDAPLPGANVIVVGTTKGGITDLEEDSVLKSTSHQDLLKLLSWALNQKELLLR